MKCIESVDKEGKKLVIRVEDNVAADFVITGKWRYVKKAEWKEAGRHYGPKQVR